MVGVLLIISLLIMRLTYRNRLPKALTFLCLFAFVLSIFWIWGVAKVLIDILQVIGVLFNVPSSFLAMTLLSFGNSVPDLTLNSALARAGYGEMGIAGSIAGPLFNLLIGLGASLIKQTLMTGRPVDFNIYQYKYFPVMIAISLLILNLVRLLLQSICLKFNLTKTVSYLGYLLYIIFVVGICMFTFVYTENPFIS